MSKGLNKKWEQQLKNYGLSQHQLQRDKAAEISVSVTEDNDPGPPQFEKDIPRSQDEPDEFFRLREELGGNNLAFTITEPIIHYRSRPRWAVNDAMIRRLVMKQFPNAIVNKTNQRRAARWVAAIYLYWRADEPLETIAEALGISVSGVKALLIRIREAGEQQFKGHRN